MKTLNKKYTVLKTFTKKVGIKRPYNGTFYECLCSCGNIFTFRAGRSNKPIACKQCSLSITTNIKKGGKWIDIPNYSVKRRLYMSYKRRAQRKSLEYMLTEEETLDLFQGNCYYCGEPPKEVTSKTDNGNTLDGYFKTNGIDRLNNNFGYTKENTVSCCAMCNKAKLTTTADDFLEWVSKVFQYQNKKGSTTRV